MKTNPNEPINPYDNQIEFSTSDFPRLPGTNCFRGLTKREYFAVMAMQGLCAQGIPGRHNMPGELALSAIDYADALIAELNKEEK